MGFSEGRFRTQIYQWWIQCRGVYPLGGCGPPMQALFSENVCKNERIGSHRGWCAPARPPPPDPPMHITGFRSQKADLVFTHIY